MTGQKNTCPQGERALLNTLLAIQSTTLPRQET